MRIKCTKFVLPLIVLLAFFSSQHAQSAKNKCSDNLSQKPEFQPIKEIMDLEFGGLVNSTVFNSYPLEEIAQSLVLRLKERGNDERVINFKGKGFRPNSGTDIMLFFREPAFKKIIKNGIENYHQTLSTNGDSQRSKRAEKEKELIGASFESGYEQFVREVILKLINSDKLHKKNQKIRTARAKYLPHRLRPKSAYVVVRDPAIDIGNVVFKAQYGTYGALMKDSVKKRSTWTPVDSLAAGEKDIFTFHDEYVNVKAYGDSYSKYYFEGQIWGEVGTQDIAAWLVLNSPNNRGRFEPPIVKAMRKSGIPVMYYELVETTHPKSGNSVRRPVILD